jgi:hypothetical protein
MGECHLFYITVMFFVAAGLSGGLTPRSRRPTNCIKFLVSGLNSDMERPRGSNSWMLKKENNFIQYLSSKSVEYT